MDDRAFEIIWQKIEIRARNIESRAPELYAFDSTSKEKLRIEYDSLRQFVKHRFMKNGKDSKLDRHKTAATFMQSMLNVPAIVVLRPFDTGIIWSENENLAIAIGLSILKAFIDNDAKSYDLVGVRKQKAIILSKYLAVNNGFKLPSARPGHGKYRDNWALEISLGKADVGSVL